MNGNLRILYDYKEIKKFFKNARNIDIYDDHTMTYYVRNNTEELNVPELEIMMETVKEAIENGKTIQSIFFNTINGLFTIVAMMIASYIAGYVLLTGVLIEVNVEGAIEYLLKLLIGVTLLGATYILILVGYFYLKNQLDKFRGRLHEIIKITIHIKNNTL